MLFQPCCCRRRLYNARCKGLTKLWLKSLDLGESLLGSCERRRICVCLLSTRRHEAATDCINRLHARHVGIKIVWQVPESHGDVLEMSEVLPGGTVDKAFWISISEGED